MKILKLIAINIVVFFILLLFANFSFAIVFGAKDYYYGYSRFNDRRAELPNYLGIDWAKNHFKEASRLKTSFHSYYGWRRQAFEGETINIDQHGLRRTASGGVYLRIGFFGGSTMWGTGARDDQTIPSLVAKKLGAEAINFGESGWRAHQSLNQLVEAYVSGETFDVVVFYDGANEVAHGCRAELEPFSHSRQVFITERLESSSDGAIGDYFAPVRRFAAAVSRRIKSGSATPFEPFDCSRDSDKSAYIARMLATDWEIARFIADRMGAQFIGILQPVAYFSETPLDNIDLNESLRPEFQAVYPLIRKAVEGFLQKDDQEYIDMTHALDLSDTVYIDWVHLSPNGNAVVANILSDHILKVPRTK